MTKQEKLKQIRQKCIEANPSILDLEMGCEVFVSGYPGRHRYIATQLGIPKYLVEFSNEISIEDFSDYHVEIIGREIRLADLLLALQKVAQINITVNWKENEIELLDTENGITAIYNLLADDIERQPEPFVDFIHTLLCIAKSNIEVDMSKNTSKEVIAGILVAYKIGRINLMQARLLIIDLLKKDE